MSVFVEEAGDSSKLLVRLCRSECTPAVLFVPHRAGAIKQHCILALNAKITVGPVDWKAGWHAEKDHFCLCNSYV